MTSVGRASGLKRDLSEDPHVVNLDDNTSVTSGNKRDRDMKELESTSKV